MLDPEQRRVFEAEFVALLLRFGARADDLSAGVRTALDESVAALSASAEDGTSLPALAVLRIRAGKFAAARLPAALYRDRAQLAALRGEIQRLSAALLAAGLERGGPSSRGAGDEPC